MGSKCVLIIDDSLIVLESVRQALEEVGLRVTTHSDPANFSIDDRPMPDLILLDVNMPVAFGDDVAWFFKQEWGVEVPIYLFSNIEEEELKRRAEDVGVDGYVQKDVGIDGVVERVLEILQWSDEDRIK